MQAVQTPIIPVVAELIRSCPGTISLGQGVVSYGPPQASIRRIFLWQGAAIGFVGTALGVALGLVGAWALTRFKLIALDPQVYFIDRLPIQIAISDVLAITAASLGIAMLATLWPARQASRLFPVEAIRHE